MELTIDDKFRITSDDRNFILERKKVAGDEAKEPGREYWTDATYHSTLQQACQKALREQISTSAACELGQVIAAIERAERTVAHAVEGMKR